MNGVRARPAVVAAAPAATQGQANLTVEFESGSDRLTRSAMRTLDVLGQAVASPALSGNAFRVVGHTDAAGRPEVNQTLSERRAQVVVDYLETHYNVASSRLTAIGKGQTEPLVPTADGAAEPRNRRVQVINLGG